MYTSRPYALSPVVYKRLRTSGFWDARAINNTTRTTTGQNVGTSLTQNTCQPSTKSRWTQPFIDHWQRTGPTCRHYLQIDHNVQSSTMSQIRFPSYLVRLEYTDGPI